MAIYFVFLEPYISAKISNYKWFVCCCTKILILHNDIIILHHIFKMSTVFIEYFNLGKRQKLVAAGQRKESVLPALYKALALRSGLFANDPCICYM